jgi:hypothetical protein
MAGHRDRAHPQVLRGAPLAILIIMTAFALASGGQWSLLTWLRLLP